MPTDHPHKMLLAAFADGELADDAADAVGEHLAYCDQCRARVDQHFGGLEGRLRHIEPQAAGYEPALAHWIEQLKQLDVATPARLGEYRIIRAIARGGMGIVYEAEQEPLGRRVALKVLPFHALLDPMQLERFRREAQAAARLHHTNIVPVFGVGEQDGTYYYAMQFIDGQSLDKVLRELRRHGDEKNVQGATVEAADVRTMTIARNLLSGSLESGDVQHAVVSDAGHRPDSDLPNAGVDFQSLDLDATIGDRGREVPIEKEAAHPCSARLERKPAACDDGPRSGAESSSSADPASTPLISDREPPSSGRPRNRRGYFDSVARIGLQVADALAYAHSQGILHRDIKPSNVLLDVRGTVWITDFGLAKSEGLDDLTQAGDVVGTLRYMAPERFRGQVDARSDLYSLGLTLYELLTLQPAFDESSRNRLIRKITQDEVKRPSRFDARISRDLETIVLKAVSREPGDRYESARQLGEDLQRFLADRPIHARRTAVIERTWRWCRRNPALALASALAVLALMAAATLSVTLAVYQSRATSRLREEQRQTMAALGDAERQRRLAEQHRLEAERLSANASFDRAQVLCERGDIGLGTLLLAQTMRTAPAEMSALRAAIRANLAHWSLQIGHLRTRLGHDGAVLAAAYSPDGRVVVTGSADRAARIWDAATGAPMGEPLWHDSEVLALAFSPDGARIITGSREAQFWQMDSGEAGARLQGHGGLVSRVAWSADGQTVLTVGNDNAARLWESASGTPIGSVLRHDAQLVAAEFDAASQRVFTASVDGVGRLWSATTGEPTGPGFIHGGRIFAAAFSPDGKFVVTAGEDKTARIWDATTGRARPQALAHQRPVIAVAVCPDGRTIVTGSEDNTARLWDAETGNPVGAPLLHHNRVGSLAFSPNGKILLTASADRMVRAWDAGTGKALGGLFHNAGATISRAGISPDGRHVIVIHDFVARAWELPRGNAITEPLVHSDGVQDLAFSPDGNVIATASLDGSARLWNPQTGTLLCEPLEHAGYVQDVAFSPDSTLVVTASLDMSAQVWSSATGKPVGRRMWHHDGVESVAFSPDNRYVLTGSRDRTARFWDARTGEPMSEPLEHEAAVSMWAVAFSPTGHLAVTGSRDGTVRLWEVPSGRAFLPPFRHPFGVSAVTFSKNSRSILVGSHAMATLWDTANGERVGEPLRHQNAVRSVAFARDGSSMATGSFDHTARIWDPETAEPRTVPLQHRGEVRRIDYSPDGKRLVTASFDHTARVWDVATGKPLGPALEHQDWVVSAAFHPNGKVVATGSVDGTARLWAAPEPLEGDPERITVWLEMILGVVIDQEGTLRILDGSGWLERRRRLAELGGPPNR